jgi:hypothetical protein
MGLTFSDREVFGRGEIAHAGGREVSYGGI